MQFKEVKDIIGTSVTYKDYLGLEREGKIAWLEEYNEDYDESEGMIVWLYIVDDDPEHNVHEIVINMGTEIKPDIRRIMYAELRLSTEVYIN